jgi:hypothetical protein
MGLCASAESFEGANTAQGGLRAGSVGGGADAAAAAIGGNALSSRVELFVSCAGLQNLDAHSKSDPFVVLEELSTGPGGTASWREIGRSEIVVNSLAPAFVKRFRYTYKFEENQRIRCRVFDADDDSADTKTLVLARQDAAGQTPPMYLADVVNGVNQTKTVGLEGTTKRGRATGTCTLRCEEMANQNGVVTLRFCAKGLTNLDGRFGASDPFLRMSRTTETGAPLPMFRSEVVMNNLSPAWHEIKVSLSALCNGDVYRPILFEVADYDGDGSHDHIGSCKASLNDLLTTHQGGQRPMPLLGPASKGGKSGGTLYCTHASVTYRPSFLDYIMGGTQINFCCAIDFTGSNGQQSSPSSLHYVSNMPNQYQQCIHRVGDVLEWYDHDKQFPTWGFGGVTRPGGAAEHCFNLVPGGPNAMAAGVEGIMAAYMSAVQSVKLSGPTIFSQVLQAAAALSSVGMDGSQYYVLLIITDGVITDMAQTKDAIVAACDLPLSILIVGVGDADFSRMEELDGDDGRLRNSRGQRAARDIVQFVPFRDFKHKTADAFSAALLAEIPHQLLTFMESKNLKPRPRQAAVVPVQPVVPVVAATTVAVEMGDGSAQLAPKHL